ncbi:hypothetical protein [Aquipseudomonas alcaligenes]|uniref:Uncharacterized protein n=1 Tax=Aquipseudomonas alcaligenes TaxID=43263 RepID=A0A1N6N7P9_AQUAC|nr:hypothetical protein [Pseudomonas alcaligenes]SIP88100.1 hypothetical protein SAMN05878282_101106 [Pseudomonas alcaligenes]
MNTHALREQIQLALVQEASSGALARQLLNQLDRLHPTIQLPAGNAHGALARFVTAYVEQVPDVLDAANTVAREAGIEAQVKPVLKLAEQFFLSPPSLLEGHQGLDALLDEAYLAHRLVEEVNDRYITHLGQPLIPLDTTVANVIAHQLIGEPFANQLDEAVHHAVDELLGEQVFQQDSVQEYRARLSNPQTVAAWQNWPCLSRQLGVELGLPMSA